MNATGRSRATVYHWLNLFKKEGLNFIETRLDRRKRNAELRERGNGIAIILHCLPKAYGINRTEWRLEDLAKVYESEYGKQLCTASISRDIKETGYTCKRAVRVLTSPDPEYMKKTKRVLDTLQNLGPKDAFFFGMKGGLKQAQYLNVIESIFGGYETCCDL